MAGTGACTATMLWRKAHAPFNWSCGGNVVSASLSAQCGPSSILAVVGIFLQATDFWFWASPMR